MYVASKIVTIYVRLKRCRTLPEREARTILMQIVTGLRYLNTPGDAANPSNGDDDAPGGANPVAADGLPRRKAIIHYDLKPGIYYGKLKFPIAQLY
jgi:serine/threonine protein kinase